MRFYGLFNEHEMACYQFCKISDEESLGRVPGTFIACFVVNAVRHNSGLSYPVKFPLVLIKCTQPLFNQELHQSSNSLSLIGTSRVCAMFFGRNDHYMFGTAITSCTSDTLVYCEKRCTFTYCVLQRFDSGPSMRLDQPFFFRLILHHPKFIPKIYPVWWFGFVLYFSIYWE